MSADAHSDAGGGSSGCGALTVAGCRRSGLSFEARRPRPVHEPQPSPHLERKHQCPVEDADSRPRMVFLIILDSEIWLTDATPDGKELSVVTVNAGDGKIVRDQKVFQIDKVQEGHPFNSYASPTPVAEPGRVYVTFGSQAPRRSTLDPAKVLWQRQDLECNHFRGPGSSPILFRNLLIMHFDCIDVQYVVALDKDTGKTVEDAALDRLQGSGPDGKPVGDGDFGRPSLHRSSSRSTDGRC